MMPIEQLINVCKDIFPSTLGSIVAVWKRKGSSSLLDNNFKEMNFGEKVTVTIIALFAIVVGICIGQWVSEAIVHYYELPNVARTLIEFFAALSGVKIIDTSIKVIDKSLEIVSDKIPTIINAAMDGLLNKVKKWFGD